MEDLKYLGIQANTPMMASTVNQQLLPIYQQRLDLQSSADPRETRCERAELETILGVGVLLFQNIRERHLAWHADVQAERIAFEIESAQGFADEYRRWNDATEYWLARAAGLEQQGIQVERLAEIRGFHEQLKLVDFDVRSLTRRWEELEEGKGVEARQFFASLKSRRSA